MGGNVLTSVRKGVVVLGSCLLFLLASLVNRRRFVIAVLLRALGLRSVVVRVRVGLGWVYLLLWYLLVDLTRVLTNLLMAVSEVGRMARRVACGRLVKVGRGRTN